MMGGDADGRLREMEGYKGEGRPLGWGPALGVLGVQGPHERVTGASPLRSQP